MTQESTRATTAPDQPEGYAVYFVRRGSGVEDKLLVAREEDAAKQVEVGLIRRVVPLFAACEPAPVARVLDVEAERREFQVAFPIPEGVEWDGHYGNNRYISRYQMHEVFEYNLRWSGWLASRTAAPAAPPDKEQSNATQKEGT